MAVLEAFDGFDIDGFMMSLQADGDCEVFLFGQFVGVDDFADTGRVNGDGFFHEHVLTGVDCGFEVQRTEAGVWQG
jgi:hypothetical protein